MKSLSIWASRNIILFRIIIPIGFLILFIFNYFLGMLFQLEWLILREPVVFLTVFVILILSFSLYPSSKRINEQFKSDHLFYFRWKLIDLILILGFCLVSFYCGTHSGQVLQKQNSSTITRSTTAEIGSVIPLNSLEKFEKRKSRSFKDRIASFFNKIGTRMLDFYHQLSNGKKALFIGLVILFGLLYLGLFYLLAIGACSIACSGYGVLALIVFILGEALLFLGLYYSIFGLKNNMDKKEGEEPDLKKNRKIGLIVTISVLVGKYLTLLFVN